MPVRVDAGHEVRSPSDTTPDVPHPSGSVGQCPFHNAANAGDAQKLRDVASETIRGNMFAEKTLEKAEKVLIAALQADPADAKGETNRLLGLTHFHAQRWGDAIKHLDVALKRDPGNADIKKLLERCQDNAATNLEVPQGQMPKLVGWELLMPPAHYLRTPQDIAPMPEAEKQGKTKTAIREVAGRVGHKVMEAAVDAAGKHKKTDVTYGFESWDSRSKLRGQLELASVREDLNGEKLQSTYDGPVGMQQPGQVRPEWTERFRTATGAWTTEEPMEGAAGTEFQRTGAPVSTRKDRANDPTLPSAREVSRALLSAKGPRTEVPFLNNLAIAWIQFQNHDWVSHGENAADGAHRIPLKADDPMRKKYGIDHLSVPRTADNPLKQDGKLTYLNEVTHWWDGSQIYGSDQATQDRLRLGADGQTLPDGHLRIDDGQLPINAETGVEDSGFTRNWWVGLDIFHTLFVKNHNAVADELKKHNPDWSTDQLFHTARLINSAQMAKIHTVEWTPAVLPNKKLVGGMGANWWGLLETMSKDWKDRRVDNGWEPKDAVLGGIVGGKRDNHGKPYGLSEDFVEVYRLHAGMLDHVDVRPVGAAKPTASIDANATRGTGSRQVMDKFGMETLLNSFGHQHMTALVNNNYPEFMQDMSVDGISVMDLGAVDILRARERGVPQYNEFRRQLGLPALKSFEDLGTDAATLEKLKSLYGTGPDAIEKMDLLVGTLCEARRPENYGFGETLFQVFIQMASRRLQADPFYTEKFTSQYYTKEGLDLIEGTTLKGLLMKHFPELSKTGLAGVNNAFEPWGTNAQTHPEEHPLTAGSERY